MSRMPSRRLVMATRSGDVDPTIPLYLQQNCGLSAADVDKMLNKQSGFKGLCDLTDLRAITTAGTPQAQLALDVSLRAISLSQTLISSVPPVAVPHYTFGYCVAPVDLLRTTMGRPAIATKRSDHCHTPIILHNADYHMIPRTSSGSGCG